MWEGYRYLSFKTQIQCWQTLYHISVIFIRKRYKTLFPVQSKQTLFDILPHLNRLYETLARPSALV